MIMMHFKNKIFPKAPTGFEGDVDEDDLLKRHERDSRMPTIEEKPEDEIPDISTFEQIAILDKFYGSDLIKKYFVEKSLTKIINKLKDYKKNPKKLHMYNSLITCFNRGVKMSENNISKMSENDAKNKKLDYLKYLVETIVDASQNKKMKKVKNVLQKDNKDKD